MKELAVVDEIINAEHREGFVGTKFSDAVLQLSAFTPIETKAT